MAFPRPLALAALLLAGLAVSSGPARAEMVSEYTDLDLDKGCAVIGKAAEGDGDWVNFVCPGWKGVPVIVSTADERQSIFYGFPPEGEAGFVWESFDAFNAAGPKIEWRIDRRDGVDTPVAAIHRWSVSDPDNAETRTEILVVEKVGSLPERQGCAMGYVIASGNAKANEQARTIADEQAFDFACGDQPTVMAGDKTMPGFSRGGN